jgi:hypothetical protein
MVESPIFDTSLLNVAPDLLCIAHRCICAAASYASVSDNLPWFSCGYALWTAHNRTPVGDCTKSETLRVSPAEPGDFLLEINLKGILPAAVRRPVSVTPLASARKSADSETLKIRAPIAASIVLVSTLSAYLERESALPLKFKRRGRELAPSGDVRGYSLGPGKLSSP